MPIPKAASAVEGEAAAGLVNNKSCGDIVLDVCRFNEAISHRSKAEEGSSKLSMLNELSRSTIVSADHRNAFTELHHCGYEVRTLLI